MSAADALDLSRKKRSSTARQCHATSFLLVVCSAPRTIWAGQTAVRRASNAFGGSFAVRPGLTVQTRMEIV